MAPNAAHAAVRGAAADMPARGRGASGGPSTTYTATTRGKPAPVHGLGVSRWHAGLGDALRLTWLLLLGGAGILPGAAIVLGPPLDTARSPQAWAALTVA